MTSPPERGGAPTPESACHHRSQSLAKVDQHRQFNRPDRQCGAPLRRGAELWREGWCSGYLTALTDVARATNDPEVWCLLDRVGEKATAPAGDDYGLAGSDD